MKHQILLIIITFLISSCKSNIYLIEKLDTKVESNNQNINQSIKLLGFKDLRNDNKSNFNNQFINLESLIKNETEKALNKIFVTSNKQPVLLFEGEINDFNLEFIYSNEKKISDIIGKTFLASLLGIVLTDLTYPSNPNPSKHFYNYGKIRKSIETTASISGGFAGLFILRQVFGKIDLGSIKISIDVSISVFDNNDNFIKKYNSSVNDIATRYSLYLLKMKGSDMIQYGENFVTNELNKSLSKVLQNIINEIDLDREFLESIN